MILLWVVLAVSIRVTVLNAAEPPVVNNGNSPRDGVESWRLEEQWRIGGDENDDVIFGHIAQVQVGETGLVFLLDAQLAKVIVLSPDGKLLQTLGREGEGPGEFSMPFDLTILPDGNLGVTQAFPGRVEVITTDGTPVRSFKPHLKRAVDGGWIGLFSCQSADDRLIISCQDVSRGDSQYEQNRIYLVGGFDFEGNPGVCYHREERKLNFRDPVLRERDLEFLWNRIAVGPDGRVAIGIPRQEYEITIFEREGSVERVIRREYESWPRNQRARELYSAWVDGIAHNITSETSGEIFKYEADIQSLRYDREGNLWSQTSRSVWEPDPGVLAEYDVFDAEGTYARRVQILAEGIPDQDMLLFPGDDRVYRVTGFRTGFLNASSRGGFVDPSGEDPEPMGIVCYRIADKR